MPIEGVLSNQPVEDTCMKGTWSNCGIAIKQALDRKPADPKDVVYLAGLWGKAFDAQYDTLRKTGHLEQATPDDKSLEELLGEKLKDFAIDKGKEAILKVWLREWPTILKWVLSPEVAAVIKVKDAYDHIPEVASDYDELLLMNDVIQQEIGEQLEPFMKPTWQAQLSQAVDQVVPQLSPIP